MFTVKSLMVVFTVKGLRVLVLTGNNSRVVFTVKILEVVVFNIKVLKVVVLV